MPMDGTTHDYNRTYARDATIAVEGILETIAIRVKGILHAPTSGVRLVANLLTSYQTLMRTFYILSYM